MSDMMEREADEPITIAETDLDRGHGQVKVTIQRQYVPPLDGTKDEVAAFDNWIARSVAELLVKFYYGYEWHVMAESRQGGQLPTDHIGGVGSLILTPSGKAGG